MRIDRAALVRDPGLPLGPDAARFELYVGRRVAREPVSRILGRREFWSLGFEITPAVLDPRPDTETLVAAALALLRHDRDRPWRLLDLGTGSGALLGALLSELPAALGWGSDRSAEACVVARRNLGNLGLGRRALVLQGSWGSSLQAGSFDLVVSNPPYIETAAITELDAEVRDHDPHPALDGGADGLAAYRALAPCLPGLLRAGGHALLEVGAGQARAVAATLRHAGLAEIRTARDLAGVERVVIGSRA